jgi:phosphoesterase RecJ-like protein
MVAAKMDPNLHSRIRELISRARRVLALAHVAPDGDAIGSLLGFGILLRAQGKELTLACEDPVPAVYTWLPGADDIVQESNGSYDLVISLDCSDERRMGKVFQEAVAGVPLLNIDHHVTNTQFGTVNWVDPSSVSTTQMILTLADAMGWELSKPVAICLLTGLMTDTRAFRTANVDTATLQAALRLMEAGASIHEITRRAMDQRTLASVRLWGQAFGALFLEDGILWTEVTRDMRRKWGVGEGNEAGLTNFLSGVRGAQIVVVFAERDNGIIDVGMRSVPGIDVAQIALSFGGGGHPQAAGCTLEAELAQVRGRVLAELRRTLSERQIEDT